jgi:hypothetical protein
MNPDPDTGPELYEPKSPIIKLIFLTLPVPVPLFLVKPQKDDEPLEEASKPCKQYCGSVNISFGSNQRIRNP